MTAEVHEGDVLRPVPVDAREHDAHRRLPGLARARAQPVVRRLRRPATAGRSRISTRSGRASGTSSASAAHSPHTAALGPTRDARSRVVPRRDAQLRRARSGRLARPGRARAHRALADARGAARPAAASSPTRWLAPAPGCSVSASAEGDRVVAYLPNITETAVAYLATREPRCDLGQLRAGVRPPRDRRPVRADRARRCSSPSRDTSTATRRSTAASEVAEIRAGAADARARRRGALRRGRRSPTPSPGTTCSPSRGRWSSSRCRSTTRWSCCSPRAPPASPRRSCTATAGCSSSSSRARACMWDLRDGDRLLWFSTTAWMLWNTVIVRAAARRRGCAHRRQPALPRPDPAVALGRGDRRDAGRAVARLRHGLPQGRHRAARQFDLSPRPADRLRRRAARHRGLRLARRADGPGRPAQRRQRGHRPVHRDRVGEPAAAGLRRRDVRATSSAATSRRTTRSGTRSSASSASSSSREPMPSMPVGFWGDTDGSRYRRGVLRHVPRHLADGRLGPLLRARQPRDHRPLRRDAQPRRRAHRHRRLLQRGRGVPRDRATASSCTSRTPTAVPASSSCSSSPPTASWTTSCATGWSAALRTQPLAAARARLDPRRARRSPAAAPARSSSCR